MAKSTREITKSNKPSRTPRARETGTPVLVRMQDDVLALVDDYRRDQPDLPNRPEAVRRMLKAMQEFLTRQKTKR